ncbi:MAG: TolC family protein [Gemmatimonadota bacterium]
MLKSIILYALALAVTTPLRAQAPLALAEAFRRADSSAYANRIAVGNAHARGAQVTAALQGILPTVRAEAGYVRSNNPLAVFGYTLQQRGVSMASFDPNSLNFPSAATNWNGGLVAEVPLVNVDAWFGRAAASSAGAAAEASAGWTRETTRVDVTRAFFGAILAREQVGMLEAAVVAGRAHVRQAESMVTNGLATKSDALLAAVQAGQLEAQLIGARGNARIAVRHLALMLGQPGDTSFILPDSLPSADQVRSLAATPGHGALRGDVAAAQLGEEAAQRDMRRAAMVYIPRLNGFGRYDWKSPDQPFGGERSYTIGVMVSWSPFSGASQIAERRAAEARVYVARAMAEAAEAGAAVEQRVTRTQLEVALARLRIAEASVEQGAEAHRIVGKKYAGGLATVAELLSAAAVETQTRLGLVDARFQAIIADAAVRQAVGADLMALTALEN